MEPRKVRVVGVVPVTEKKKGATALLCRTGLAQGARPGSESTAYAQRGPSRNLGAPVIPAEERAGEGPGRPKIQACGRGRPHVARANPGGAQAVRPGEGQPSLAGWTTGSQRAS